MSMNGEMLAAREVAELKRMNTFGFDETTKFQVGTSNVQCDTTDGRVVDIVMRGAFVIEGGTAEQVMNAVETKDFARGRKLLARWLD
eukprot:2061919-Pleurochrysis_carterae.AAC.1